MTEHTIEALCRRSRDISLEKGWLNPDGTDPRPFYTVIGLFHTELSEAFEDARNNRRADEVYYEYYIGPKAEMNKSLATGMDRKEREAFLQKYPDAKPCGIPIEFADFVIRVCQWAGSTGNGSKLHDLMEAAREATIGARIVPDALEECITKLHADVSQAYVAGLNGGDPVIYLSVALLSVSDFCQKHDINLWAAIDEKEAFNRTRPIKHGGKKH